MIYRPLAFTDVDKFILQWNKLAKENGLGGFYFIGYSLFVETEYDSIKQLGFDAVCSCRLNRNVRHGFAWAVRKAYSMIFKTPRKTAYKVAIKTMIGEEDKKEDVFPTMLPNWDHTPRSGYNGDLFTNSTPEIFEKHCEQVLSLVKEKPKERQIAFLKSWNEWGEGNYMEPDLKYGKGYIKALRLAITNVLNKLD